MGTLWKNQVDFSIMVFEQREKEVALNKYVNSHKMPKNRQKIPNC